MASATNAQRIVQFSFAQGLAEAQGMAAKCGRIVPSPGTGDFRVGNGAFGGLGQTLTGTATSVSNSDWFTYETSHAMVTKVIKHVVPAKTMVNDYAFQNAGAQLAASAIATMDKGFFDGLEGLFSAAHPRVGTGAGQVGSSKKYLDTGLAYCQGESGAGTQDSLLTSALDEAALNTAIKLLLNQRNDRGIPMHIGTSGGLCLAVAPKNAQVAHELVKSQLSGSDYASNFVNGIISDICVYPFTTDDDDWFLCSPSVCPVGLAVGSDPTARISMTTDGLFYELVAEVQYTFWKSPYSYGIVGSNVA